MKTVCEVHKCQCAGQLCSDSKQSASDTSLMRSCCAQETLLSSPLLSSPVLSSPLLSSPLLYSTLLYSTLLYSTLLYSTLNTPLPQQTKITTNIHTTHYTLQTANYVLHTTYHIHTTYIQHTYYIHTAYILHTCYIHTTYMLHTTATYIPHTYYKLQHTTTNYNRHWNVCDLKKSTSQLKKA